MIWLLDRELDDVEMHVTRIKPEGLDVLCRDTKFTRKELQIMYRGFKQVRAIPKKITNKRGYSQISFALKEHLVVGCSVL